ncbi:hypothetical protein [Bradyrhizobium sp. SZCCHNR2026]|uniref:hypothetical protein n=1 Tax=Bradyrhizobium sp. SZCCHNR2026 TaxID=3057381 RepID=UPI0029170058|nr:hypothetical protein [Bradyrhizobium sp. SZCCHNR2026]
MSRWFRMYDDVINDPKVMRLPEAVRWQWVALLCCASKNGGRLPPADDLAFLLRLDLERLASVLETLQAAGLLDQDEEGIAPHNWNGRQFASDSSSDRVKRHREKKRNAASNVAGNDSGNVAGNGECNVTSAVTVTPPEAETDTETDIAVADEPRTGSLIGKAASDLAEQLLIIAGHDPAFWPPGWCGAPLRVQTWLNQGWPPEIITAAVKGAAARKTGAPAASVQFFEKAIAEEVARQRAPVPVVEVKPAQSVRIASHGRPQAGNVIQAADRLVETLNRFDDGPGHVDQIRGGARPAPARLLSAG